MTFRVSPRVPEGLLLFAVVFGPLAFGATEPWSLAILEFTVFLMLFFFSVQGAPDLRRPIYRTALPAVLGIVLIGLCQSLNPHPSVAPALLRPFTASAHGTSRELLLWCAYAALLWCAPQILSDRAAMRRFVWTVFVLGAVIAVEGIIQRGQGNTAYYGFRPIREGNPFGPYTNYDHAASLLVMAALVGSGVFLSRFTEFREKSEVGRISEWVAGQLMALFLLSLIVAGVVLTRSRGGLHSFFISAWLVGLGSIRWEGKKIVLLAACGFLLFAAGAYGFMVWSNPHLIGWAFKKPVGSMAMRFSMYHSGVRISNDFPFFGVGLGGLMGVFSAYQEKLVVGIVQHIHSDWLELLVETGIVGFGMVFLGLGLYVCRVLGAWRRLAESRVRSLVGGGVAAIAAFLLHNMIEFSFQIPANAIVFFAVMAWVGAVGFPLEEAPAELLAASSSFLRSTLCAAALILGIQAVRPAVAQAYSLRSDIVPPMGRVRLLARAYRWDPDPLFFYQMGEIEWAQTGNGSPAECGLRDSIRVLDAARRLDPLNPRFRMRQANNFWRLGRVADATFILRGEPNR